MTMVGAERCRLRRGFWCTTGPRADCKLPRAAMPIALGKVKRAAPHVASVTSQRTLRVVRWRGRGGRWEVGGEWKQTHKTWYELMHTTPANTSVGPPPLPPDPAGA